MPRFVRRILLTSLFVNLLIACGGSDDSNGPSPADLEGRWRITYSNVSGDGITCATSAIDYTISQSGRTFTGTSNSVYILQCTDGVSLASDTLVGAIITNGHIDGRSVEFDLATSTFHQAGTISGNSISGSATWMVDLGSSGTVVMRGRFGGARL
ncbi:MAG TPA: hypothetical protein VG817_08350 [Gemmatimonadales bacterium]|nr:hypothetical protein [Gemmatimonadales bacterium]